MCLPNKKYVPWYFRSREFICKKQEWPMRQLRHILAHSAVTANLETSSLMRSTVPSRSKGEANSAESAVDKVSGGDNAKDGQDGEG